MGTHSNLNDKKCWSCAYYTGSKNVKGILITKIETDGKGICTYKNSNKCGKEVSERDSCYRWSRSSLIETELAKQNKTLNVSKIEKPNDNVYIQSLEKKKINNEKAKLEYERKQLEKEKKQLRYESDHLEYVKKKEEYSEWYSKLTNEEKQIEDEKKKLQEERLQQWKIEYEIEQKKRFEEEEQKRKELQQLITYKNQKLNNLNDIYSNVLEKLNSKNKKLVLNRYNDIYENIKKSYDYSVIDNQVDNFETFINDIKMNQSLNLKKRREIKLYALEILLSSLFILFSYFTIYIVSEASLNSKYEYQHYDYMLYEEFNILPDNVSKEEFLEMYQQFINANEEWSNIINVVIIVSVIISITLTVIFTYVFIFKMIKIKKVLKKTKK